MSIDQYIVTTLGLSLIIFIWWFFFDKKNYDPSKQVTEMVKDNLKVQIVVDGGYKPAVIFLKKNVKTTLRIIRKDSNNCLSDIILPDFKISEYLPVNKTVEVKFTPKESGEFPFHCGMNMFHGKLVVND